MSTALLRPSTLAGARRLARTTTKARASTMRAFASRAASGSSSSEHHPAKAPHEKDAPPVVQKQAPPAPALRAWPPSAMARRPSSLLGSALFGYLDREFDSLLNSIWGPLTAAQPSTTPLASAAVPRVLPGLGAVDVSENDQGYTIAMDMPGVPKDAVDITIADNVLTVAGHRSEEKKEGGGEGGKGPVVRERVWGSFSRSFKLPADAEVDGIKASMDHGVLKLVVPRKAETAPEAKKVAIE